MVALKAAHLIIAVAWLQASVYATPVNVGASNLDSIDDFAVLEKRQSVAAVAAPSSVAQSLLTPLATAAVQTATGRANTQGFFITTLDTRGNPPIPPFPTVSPSNTVGNLSLIPAASAATVEALTDRVQVNIAAAATAQSIFAALPTGAPPPQISRTANHPVSRGNILAQSRRLQTNKFYSNFFLGNQQQSAFVHPYSVNWAAGGGQSGTWGLAISHTERSQLGTADRTSGPGGQWRFYINPLGIHSFALSATGLGQGTTLRVANAEAFSAEVRLFPSGATNAMMTFPIVQGMGFVTATYRIATPLLQSGVGFRSMVYVGKTSGGNIFKYRAVLQDNTTWVFYVCTTNPNYFGNAFRLINGNNIQGRAGFTGWIQVAKIPNGTTGRETTYDRAAGAYAIAGNISGSVTGTSGTYTIRYSKGGFTNNTLLMFALPHHQQSLDATTRGLLTNVELMTTTKGLARAVLSETLTMTESNIPAGMGFAPWSPTTGSRTALSATARNALLAAARSELLQNMNAQTNSGSAYFDGKAFAKFAALIYAVNDLGQDRQLALTGLATLKAALNVHISNQQQHPWLHESVWGGLVSSATYNTGDPNADFGNTYYNDHHFHYSYFVYTAAVIGYLDVSWLSQGTNREWVNMLVREFANPLAGDPWFPFQRSFDWYHGHSWAKGLFESWDSKDQESSSEDAMASYALKMWGLVSGNRALEARGNLMLSIQARSMQSYYLYENSNTVQPSQIIGNRVAGILFENKIDHTTYFGSNIEFIQGIHMIPIMPFSALIRTRNFVSQEWSTYFSNSRINSIAGGWRGIIWANYAILSPAAAWNFFRQANFDASWIDGGASRTWYLAYTGALGGY